MNIGNRVAVVRKLLNISQRPFAKRLGISAQSLSSLEIGKIAPSDRYIHHICLTFNVNEDWLRFGVGEIFINASNYETDLLKVFRELLPEIQIIALEQLKTLRKTQQATLAYQNNHRTELLLETL